MQPTQSHPPLSHVTPGNHPSEAVLLDHAANTLFTAHRLVVETHLLDCQACRDAVALFGQIGTALVGTPSPVEPPPEMLSRCLSSLQTEPAGGPAAQADRASAARHRLRGTTLPPPLDDLRPTRLRWIAPGVRHSTLCRDEHSTLHLIRAEAGVALPPHHHRGLELTYVLDGAFRDNGGRYEAGDLAEEDDDDEANPRRGHDHLVRAEPDARCTCLIATTGRLRFSGWMARLLQPVMPF